MDYNKKIYNLIKFIAKYFLKIFFPYKIIGIENIQNLNNNYIICSNHVSNLDPIFLIISNIRPIFFMAKSELFKNKIFGSFLYLLGVFPVNRGKGDNLALSKAEEILKNKNILGIFIEGKRSKNGEFLKPRLGTALLANNSGSLIIPVCITGSSSNKKIKIFKKTVISFGEPILIEDLKIYTNSKSELRQASDLIMEKIKILRNNN